MSVVIIEEYLNRVKNELNELNSLKDVFNGKISINAFINRDVAHISVYLNGVASTDKPFSDIQDVLTKYGFYSNTTHDDYAFYYSYYRYISDILNDMRVKGLKDLLK